MGEIIFWTIIRVFVVIPIIWFLKDSFTFQLWVAVSFITITVIIVYPIFIKLKEFELKNKKILEDTICSSCKHFSKSAVLCNKLDEHPTEDYIPCDGLDWEPIL